MFLDHNPAGPSVQWRQTIIHVHYFQQLELNVDSKYDRETTSLYSQDFDSVTASAMALMCCFVQRLTIRSRILSKNLHVGVSHREVVKLKPEARVSFFEMGLFSGGGSEPLPTS